MKLNQVTLAGEGSRAVNYILSGSLGLVLIVQNDHYARFENPSEQIHLSLELRARTAATAPMSISNATIWMRGSRI